MKILLLPIILLLTASLTPSSYAATVSTNLNVSFTVSAQCRVSMIGGNGFTPAVAQLGFIGGSSVNTQTKNGEIAVLCPENMAYTVEGTAANGYVLANPHPSVAGVTDKVPVYTYWGAPGGVRNPLGRLVDGHHKAATASGVWDKFPFYTVVNSHDGGVTGLPLPPKTAYGGAQYPYSATFSYTVTF